MVVGSIPGPSCENSYDQELGHDIPVANICQPPSVNILKTLDTSNLNLMNNGTFQKCSYKLGKVYLLNCGRRLDIGTIEMIQLNLWVEII